MTDGEITTLVKSILKKKGVNGDGLDADLA